MSSGSADFKPRDFVDCAVTVIRVVAHTMGVNDVDPQTSDNHWSNYLLLTGRREQYRLHAVEKSVLPSAAHWRPARIDHTVVVYEDDMSRSMNMFWDFTARKGLKVSHVLELITGKGRDRYQLPGPGESGRRYWV